MIKLQELYHDINYHLINDETPSQFINSICDSEKFNQYPFNLLVKLKTTKQSPQHHPEGCVWNHTMLVIDQAAKVKNQSKWPQAFMWAALLHDIGKPDTTKIRKGKITSYDHDKVGAEIAKEFLSTLTDDNDFISKVTNLIRYHMHILFVVNNLPFADIVGMKQKSDIEEVALLGLCDRLGRLNVNKQLENENIKQFLLKSK